MLSVQCSIVWSSSNISVEWALRSGVIRITRVCSNICLNESCSVGSDGSDLALNVLILTSVAHTNKHSQLDSVCKLCPTVHVSVEDDILRPWVFSIFWKIKSQFSSVC